MISLFFQINSNEGSTLMISFPNELAQVANAAGNYRLDFWPPQVRHYFLLTNKIAEMSQISGSCVAVGAQCESIDLQQTFTRSKNDLREEEENFVSQSTFLYAN